MVANLHFQLSWLNQISFHMELSLIYKIMDVQEKLIWIWKAVHQDSFSNRGKEQLGNGF